MYNALIENDNKTSFVKKVSIFIRGNFFIPDARCFWIRPSIKFLDDYLKKNPVDCIISTGPPHSMHLIAMGLKQKHPNVKWIADFRDPWTQIYNFQEFMISAPALLIHKRLEKKVLNLADKIVTVSQSCADDFKKICHKEINIIHNGYDEADFSENVESDPNEFVLSYVGSINSERNPINLWQTLSKLVKSNEEFSNKLKIKFIGVVDKSVSDSILQFGLSTYYNAYSI
ncbi:MAG: glycosyltransferase [Saprospiraceae bacterium]|nr:glycosyltransferase [Saprospiraceae bacterium]